MVKTLVLVSDSLFCAGVFGKQDLIYGAYTRYTIMPYSRLGPGNECLQSKTGSSVILQEET